MNCKVCGFPLVRRDDPCSFGYYTMCACGKRNFRHEDVVKQSSYSNLYSQASRQLVSEMDSLVEAEELCTRTESRAIRATYKEKRQEQKEKGLMPSEKATAVVNLIVNQTGGSASGEQTKQLATVVDTLLDMKHSSGMKFPPDITLDGIIKVLVTAVLTGFVLRHFPDLKDQLFPKKDEEKVDAAVCTQPASGAA